MAEPQVPNHSPFLARIVAVIILSSVLGFTFNASNPLGIRFGAEDQGKTTEQGSKDANSTASIAVPNAAQAPIPLATQPPGKSPVPVTVSGQPNALPPQSAATASPQPATSSLATNIPSYTPPSPTSWANVKPILQQGRLILVDARAKPMFDAGHIPGAVSLPESSLPEDIIAFQKQYGTNAHVVVYCSSTSCSLSFKLANKLAKDYGFGNVQFMTGGYLEWQRETTLAAGTTSAAGQTGLGPAPQNSSQGFQLPPPFPDTSAGSDTTPRTGSQPVPKPKQ